MNTTKYFCSCLLVPGAFLLATVGLAAEGVVVTHDGAEHVGEVSLAKGGFSLVTTAGERRQISLTDISSVSLQASPERLADAGILGSGWESLDYGPGVPRGFSGQANGRFVLKTREAGGHLVYQPASATGQTVVRVDALSDGARAGLQVRSAKTNDADFSSVLVTTDGSVQFAVTTDDDQAKTYSTSPGTVKMPCWLKLDRSQRTHEAFCSQDGETWMPVGKPVPLPSWADEEGEEEDGEEEDEARVFMPILAGLCLESKAGPAVANMSDVHLHGTGLKGEYFAGDFQERVLTHGGETLSPRSFPGPAVRELLGQREFSIRFTGELVPRETGRHRFFVWADQSAAVWIDGKPVAGDKWSERQPRISREEGDVDLQAARAYSIRVDYYFRGDADAEHHLSINMQRPEHEEDEPIPSEMLGHEIHGADNTAVEEASPGIVLGDGSFLAGRLLSASASQLVLVTAKSESVVLPRDVAQRIIVTARAPDAETAETAETRRLGARTTTGDFLEGSLQDAGNGQLRMKSLLFGVSSFSLVDDSLAEVILRGPASDAPAADFEIRDIVGSRWLVSGFPTLTSEYVAFLHPLLGEQQIPGESLAGMTRLNSRVPTPAAADNPDNAVVSSKPGRSISFPPCDAVVDVTKRPYNAAGDGQTDDTEAIQRALRDSMGRHKIVYLPNGTYVVSKTIRWSKQDSQGQEAWGFNFIQGESTDKTILRLKDGSFAAADSPQPMMWCGGFGSADWFHNYIQSVTFDVGRDNPGAVGLHFYSNNTGALRDVRIVSQDGRGAVGLDLASDMNGPLLVRNVEVQGFGVGIRCDHSVNSQTFEHLRLVGQSECGLRHDGQCISVRGLVTQGSAPAIQSNSGLLALLEASLTGEGRVGNAPAISAKGLFLARDIETTGFREAIVGPGDNHVPGPKVSEFLSHPPTSPFPSPKTALRLPIKETPDLPWDDPNTWAVVDAFGADSTGSADSSAAIQKAIDSGATTVFFPGAYRLESTVIIRGRVRRLIGTGNSINYGYDANPEFRIVDGDSPIVMFEHFHMIGDDHPGIEVATDRTVVLRSIETQVNFKGRGEVFLEDFCTHDLRVSPGQKVWARQLNVENQGTHVTNNGGTLWILGFKTERGGTLLDTRGGGRSEVFGNFSYTTTAGRLAPMFVNADSSMFAFFHEVCYSGDPFHTLIRESRGGETKEVIAGQGGIAPYIGQSEE